MNKNAIAAILAAATMTVALSAHATTSAPAVPPITQDVQAPAPKVTMNEAVAKAEKAGDAQSRSVRLHMSQKYGQVWDVRMVRDDQTRVRSFVDAQTGRVVASDVMGIHEPAHRGMGKPGHKMKCAAMGMSHAKGSNNGPNNGHQMH